ncbi:hypothetical protein [Mesorhizobium caraganae]|uniref:hypothetical protein n=1 Tax=Mesorhizobium caraganae TaxID=483206 RepID=UPI00177DA02B|nr:hypothetical protein [Mesorhizobium caraganae]
MKTFAILCALLPLSGFTTCSWIDRHSALTPTPAHVSDNLKKPCGELTDIPDRDLTQEESNPLWAQDRRVGGCAIRKNKALVKAITVLEQQGQKK